MFPMGMCVSGDIFQSKVDELHSDIEGVKTYIDDIMVLDKGFFYQDIDQLRIIFARLRSTGIKLNTPKCIFVLKGFLTRAVSFLGKVFNMTQRNFNVSWISCNLTQKLEHNFS